MQRHYPLDAHFPASLSAVLDSVPVGLALLDRERRLVYVNLAMESLTGYSVQESRGLFCANILRCNRSARDCPVAKAGQLTEPVSFDGTILSRARQKIAVQITLSPILDEHGRLTGYLETIEDLRYLTKAAAKRGDAFGFAQMIGRSLEMERIFNSLPFIAQTDASLLLTGETGTGKDILAEAIHEASNRAKGPFVKVNCGALPETLLESELFGHRKGAFTGAVEHKPGRFQLAHNGTLFLTEIGDLPLSLQVKLLTILDDRVVYPLGSTKGTLVNVRVIAATHYNLEQMVQAGRFRKDLLFRLNVLRLHLPPLRERNGDIRLLMDHFLQSFATKLEKNIGSYSEEVLAMLLGYGYPGNVRELRNIVEYSCTLCQGSEIKPRDLPAYLTSAELAAPTDQTRQTVAQPGQAPAAPGFSWQHLERERIIAALQKTGGRRAEAAKVMGLGRSTLWRKMRKYGLATAEDEA